MTTIPMCWGEMAYHERPTEVAKVVGTLRVPEP